MKPICVPCQRFYRPKENGFPFIEGMPVARTADEARAKAGKAEPDKWTPYKLWMGDLWHCPDCAAEIIVGTGAKPIAEHYEQDFVEHVLSFGAKLQVNDC